MAARTLTRLARRGGDGVHSRGIAIVTVDPRAIERLARGRRIAIVTGTNGKTTTSHLLACALGGPVAHNRTGANMRSGVVVALADSDADMAVLEVDELHAPEIIARTSPEVVVLLNATRDQLDRSHEITRVVGGWREALAMTRAIVVANAADPNVAYAVPDGRGRWVDPGLRWSDDAASCPWCGGLLRWLPPDPSTWGCACGRSMPAVDVAVEDTAVSGPDAATRDLRLAIPGAVNRGNAALALAAAVAMGIDTGQALARMGTVDSAFGRYVRYDIGGRPARLILAKNPAGMSAALDLVGDDPLIVGINAQGVDGRDTSWLYDVPFELLMGRTVGVTGERRDDLALRLAIAGAHPLVDADPHALAARMPAGDLQLVGNYSNFARWRRERAWVG